MFNTKQTVLIFAAVFFTYSHVLLAVEEKNILENSEQDLEQEDNYSCIHKILDMLISVKGAAGLACFYALQQGFGNILWGMNYSKHFGVDPNVHADLQEASSFFVATGSIFLGALAPVVAYQYNKHVNKKKKTPKPRSIRDLSVEELEEFYEIIQAVLQEKQAEKQITPIIICSGQVHDV